MKRFIAMLLLVTVLTGVLVGTEKKGSFDLTGKDPEVPVSPNVAGQDPEYPVTPNVMGRNPETPVILGKKGSFDITEKKGSFDITEKRPVKATPKKGSFDITEKKGSFDTEGKDPEFPVTPN